MMRYELQIKSKTFEIGFTLVVLVMALVFSENEIFWGKKSWRNSCLFYLLEISVLGLWIYSLGLQLAHVFRKYVEIIRRRDHADDESIPTYGITSGIQRNSIDGILTLGEVQEDKKNGSTSSKPTSEGKSRQLGDSDGEFESGQKKSVNGPEVRFME